MLGRVYRDNCTNILKTSVSIAKEKRIWNIGRSIRMDLLKLYKCQSYFVTVFLTSYFNDAINVSRTAVLIDQRLNSKKLFFFNNFVELWIRECRFSTSLRKSILSRTFYRQLQQCSSPPSVMNKTAHSQKFPRNFSIQNSEWNGVHTYIYTYILYNGLYHCIYYKNVLSTFIKTSFLHFRRETFLLLSLTTRVQEPRWADSTLKGSTRDKHEEG